VTGGTQQDGVRGWWVLGTLAPFGLGSGPAFWYAGRRAGVPRWVRAGAAWFALSLAGYLTALATKDTGSPVHAVALAAMFAGWGGALLHALAIRRAYVERVNARLGPQTEAARQARADAEAARRIAREDPRLARELGIGRPDERGAYDAGLVDVNHARADGIARLPGVDPALARRIAAAREEAGGFASAEDLGAVLDLDPDTVERIRPRAIFLPR
jgi:DNA uptake protein ComE-like DNA-binding protein